MGAFRSKILPYDLGNKLYFIRPIVLHQGDGVNYSVALAEYPPAKFRNARQPDGHFYHSHELP